MPPIPTSCQGLAADVTTLEGQAQALRTDALNAVGAAAWTKLGELGNILLDLDRKRAELTACVNAHTGSVVCELALMDAGGGGVGDDRIASLWDLSGAAPELKETVPVQGGSFAFTGSMPSGEVGVTIAGTDSTTTTGPDFRSGPVTTLPAGPPRVEVVLGPVVTLTADDIARWFAAIPAAPTQSFGVPAVGNVEVTVDSVAAALAPPGLRLTAVGTVTLSAVAVGQTTSPVSAVVTLGMVPSTHPDPLVPAELTLIAPPHVDLAGPAALFGAVLNAALSGFLGDLVLTLMRPIVRDEVAAAVAQAFSLSGLPPPPAVTLSIRKLSIGQSSVTFQPVLGALGNILSRFQPTAGELTPP